MNMQTIIFTQQLGNWWWHISRRSSGWRSRIGWI